MSEDRRTPALRHALLPAAGAGRRARPLTRRRPKCLLEVDGTPLLQLHLRTLADELGVTDAVIVIGPDGDAVREHVDRARPHGLDVRFVECDDPTIGLARGMALAEPHLSEPFALLLPDEYCSPGMRGTLPALDAADFALCGAIEDEDPRRIARNYAIDLDGDRVVGLREKPPAPERGWLGCGTFVLRPSIFDAVRATPPSPRTGVVELVDVLDRAARSGRRVRLAPLRGSYVNVNTPEDLRRACDLARREREPRVSVVVPARDEEDAIAGVVADFRARVDEVLVVDNRSSDATVERARRAGARVERVRAAGYGDTLRHGLDRARGDLVVLAEADGSFHAEDLDKLLVYARSADLVVGTRTTRQLVEEGSDMGALLRWGNVAAGKLLEALWWAYEPRFTDVGCTYRAIWRSSWRTIRERARATGPEFSPEMMIEALRAHLRVVEVPVSYHPRVGGASKHSGGRLAVARTAWRMARLVARKRLVPGRRPRASRRGYSSPAAAAGGGGAA